MSLLQFVSSTYANLYGNTPEQFSHIQEAAKADLFAWELLGDDPGPDELAMKRKFVANVVDIVKAWKSLDESEDKARLFIGMVSHIDRAHWVPALVAYYERTQPVVDRDALMLLLDKAEVVERRHHRQHAAYYTTVGPSPVTEETWAARTRAFLDDKDGFFWWWSMLLAQDLIYRYETNAVY